MTGPVASKVLNATTARFLLDSHNMQYLRPYLEQARSIQQAAHFLKIGVGKMSYWTHKLLDMELLCIVETVPRAGKPVHLYQVSALEFVAPLSLLPEWTYLDFVRWHGSWWWETFLQEVALAGRRAYPDWKLRLSATEMVHRLEPDWDRNLPYRPEEYPLHDWFHATLSPEQSIALQAELRDLMKKYQHIQHPTGDRYMFHFGMARRSDGGEGSD